MNFINLGSTLSVSRTFGDLLAEHFEEDRGEQTLKNLSGLFDFIVLDCYEHKGIQSLNLDLCLGILHEWSNTTQHSLPVVAEGSSVILVYVLQQVEQFVLLELIASFDQYPNRIVNPDIAICRSHQNLDQFEYILPNRYLGI